jgi:hypothetical protein
MLAPQSQLRTFTAQRRLPSARLIRPRADTARLTAAWPAEIYGALLNLEKHCERSRDALTSNDDASAAGIGRDLALRAMTISRALDRRGRSHDRRLSASQKARGVIGAWRVRKRATAMISDSRIVPNHGGLFPRATPNQTYRHLSTER